jgi:methyl-accepting chemotaxis protein
VRKLAERSQVAAQEIGQLAGSSVQMAERAGKLLSDMVPSIQKTSELVQEIAAASGEQSDSVTQINTAMEHVNGSTQQNASAAEELSATAEELSAQAAQLQGLMASFRFNADAAPTDTLPSRDSERSAEKRPVGDAHRRTVAPAASGYSKPGVAARPQRTRDTANAVDEAAFGRF